MRFDELVVDQALKQLGAPYLWAGRGTWLVRDVPGPDGKVLKGQIVHPSDPVVGCPASVPLVFDCAGLVLYCARRAGWLGPGASALDGLGEWGADTLLDHLPEYDLSGERPGDCNRLVFYGPLGGRATHVAIDIGRGLIIEAAGGDQTTLTYADAQKRTRMYQWPAAVAVRREFRRDRLGSRSLLALQYLPSRPPVAYPTPPIPPPRS